MVQIIPLGLACLDFTHVRSSEIKHCLNPLGVALFLNLFQGTRINYGV
jgi:hypothetical protein